jgi:hypothetical protein
LHREIPDLGLFADVAFFSARITRQQKAQMAEINHLCFLLSGVA